MLVLLLRNVILMHVSPLVTPYSSFLNLFVSKSFFYEVCQKFQKREMDNYTYGEVFEREAPRSSRTSRSTAQYKTSYNEDLMSPNIGDEGDDGDARPSTFPCANFLSDAGILEDFLLLVNGVGLTTYMTDESNQYALLTKIFVESLKFTNSHFKPSIAFKIYDKSITMSLEKFCGILGIPMFGTTKKIQHQPTNLLELYRGVTNDDDRIAQHGKIRNI
jgi:hypothetical protein